MAIGPCFLLPDIPERYHRRGYPLCGAITLDFSGTPTWGGRGGPICSPLPPAKLPATRLGFDSYPRRSFCHFSV